MSLPFLGGCSGQYNDRIAKIPIKYNVTQIKDWTNPSQWRDVDFTIENPNYQAACNGNNPYASNTLPPYECGDGVNGNLWCYRQIDDTYFKPCGAGSSSFSTGLLYPNCYHQSADTGSSSCRVLGYKKIFGKKAWQGIKSYTSTDWNKEDCWDWCGDGCAKREIVSTADHTKYRSMTAYATWQHQKARWTCGDVGNPYEYCCSPRGCSPGADGCECKGCTGEGITCESNCSVCCNSCPITRVYNYGGNASSTCTIDTSGNLHGSCASSSYGAADYNEHCDGDPDCLHAASEYLAQFIFGQLGEVNNNYTSLITIFSGIVNGLGTPDIVSGGCGSWHLEWHSVFQCFTTDDCANCNSDMPYTTAVVTVSPTSLDYQTWAVSVGTDFPINSTYCTPDATSHYIYQSRHETWNYSATSYDHTISLPDHMYTPLGGYDNIHIHCDIGTPYTTQEVYDDLVLLMSKWDMGKDEVYPWRTGNKFKGPLVSRHETEGGPSIPYCTNDTTYTGKILGEPGPEGIDRIWNASQPVYCPCTDTVLSEVPYDCNSLTIRTYGEWSTDGCEVPRATQWITPFDSLDISDSAFCGNKVTYIKTSKYTGNDYRCGSCEVDESKCSPNSYYANSDTLWACKTAEAIIPERQSWNYCWPCAEWRWQLTGSGAINYISEFSASIVTLDTGSGANSIVVGQTASICGTGDSDGIYKVLSKTGTTVTVGPCLSSASMFPYSPYGESCGTGWIANTQWNVPAICGQIPIKTIFQSTGSNTSSSIEITVEPCWVISNDNIIVSRATGSNINGTWKAIQIDSEHFILSGSVYSGSYHGGVLGSPGGCDQRINNTRPEQQFQVRQWYYSYRDIGEWYAIKANYDWNSGLGQCCYPTPDSGCDCDPYTPAGNCNCPRPTVPAKPRQNQCGIDETISQQTCLTGHVDFTSCRAMVAYFSPNSESFVSSGSVVTSAKNFGWHWPNIDSNYGTMWKASVVQLENSLLWQRPPCPPQLDGDPASYGCHAIWRQDDGNCNADQAGDPELGISAIKYYAHIPVYEATCEVSASAPPLRPEAEKVGCVTTPGGDCTKNICLPPEAPHNFLDQDCCGGCAYGRDIFYPPYEQPWILIQAEEGCICQDGRFKQDYIRNGRFCLNDEVPAP